MAITLSNTYPLINKIRPDTSLQQVIVVQIKNYFPALKKLLFVLLLEKKRGHKVDIREDANATYFSDLLWNKEDASFVPAEISGDDTAILMYTGDTTGRRCIPAFRPSMWPSTTTLMLIITI